MGYRLNRGSSLATSFDDTFTRANASYGWGVNWSMGHMYSSVGGNQLPSIVSNRGRITESATAGYTNGIIIPIGLAYLLSSTRAKYSQVTIQACGGTSSNIGPAIFTSPTGGYIIRRFAGNPTAVCDLRRFTVSNTGDLTETALASNITSHTLGDTLRLEMSFTSSDVTLVSKKNGTLVNTYVDTNAARISTGIPGIYVSLGASGDYWEITSFSGGVS